MLLTADLSEEDKLFLATLAAEQVKRDQEKEEPDSP
jgi:hypothetical protein